MIDLLVAMPRKTDTSLFKSHVTLTLFLTICLIGAVLAVLIFLQNYKKWKGRKTKVYAEKQIQLEAEKAANKDFLNSIVISLIVLAGFVFLIIVTMVNLIQ